MSTFVPSEGSVTGARGPSPVKRAIMDLLPQIQCRPLTLTIKSDELDEDITFTFKGQRLAGPAPNDHGIITRVARVEDDAIVVIWNGAKPGTFAPMFFSDLDAFLAFENITEKMKAQVIAAYDKEEIDLAEMVRTEMFLDEFCAMQ